MKHLLRISMALSLAVIAGSCTSIKSAKVNELDHVAVVNISVDNHVDMSGFVGLVAFAEEMAKSGEFDLSDVTENMHGEVFNRYAGKFPFSILPEEKVIGSTSYSDYVQRDTRSAIARNQKYQSYQGYHVLHARKYNERKIQQLFNVLPPETDAVLFVNAFYTLKKQAVSYGTGTAKIRANLDMMLINREGDVIMKVLVSDYSEDLIKFALSGSEMDTYKVREMCVDATNSALEKANNFFIKKF